uniref:Uncharacterized protein n=1 Tax=Lepeophtheirus salmonis TaxID=72036 RepID=A0A0K2UUP2_LEPSM
MGLSLTSQETGSSIKKHSNLIKGCVWLRNRESSHYFSRSLKSVCQHCFVSKNPISIIRVLDVDHT